MCAKEPSVQPDAVPTSSYGAEAFAADFAVSAEQLADLHRFQTMVEETNAVMNLVGPATLPEFWGRHVLDSAQLLRVTPGARIWADLGAGAGFPGLVLAILLKSDPSTQVHLIDSLGKRCRFLREVVQALDLPADVHEARAESLRIKVEVVTARALAPLEKLLGFAQPYFRLGAEGLFLKGEKAEAELREARKSWKVEADLLPSMSDPRGRVVRIRRLDRAR
jgi:16S rRNA (guanine527-N7)-methyltransferase